MKARSLLENNRFLSVWAGGLCVGLVSLVLAGCAQWHYDRIQVGQSADQARYLFPERFSRRTAHGVCYLERGALGRTDVAVTLLTRDRQVAGKLLAGQQRRDFGFGVETTYTLVGELDPQRMHLGGAGSIDVLRAVADQLTAGEMDAFTAEAHGWIAAGLVRLIERWPQGYDAGPAVVELEEVLTRVPGGGQAELSVDSAGHLHVRYAYRQRQ